MIQVRGWAVLFFFFFIAFMSFATARAGVPAPGDAALESAEERELVVFFPPEVLALKRGDQPVVLRFLEAAHPELGHSSVDAAGFHRFLLAQGHADRIDGIRATVARLGGALGKVLPSPRIQALNHTRMLARRMGKPDVVGLIVKYREPAKRAAAAKGQRLAPRDMQRLSGIVGKTVAYSRAMSGESFATYFDTPTDLATGEQLAQRLAMDPEVESVDLNTVQEASLVPNDQYFALQWNLTSPVAGIRAPQAWDITTGSSGIVVGIVDTGYLFHPDLDARVLPGADVITDPATARDGDGRDLNAADMGTFNAAGECGADSVLKSSSWHGTHVMGILGAIGNNGIGIAGVDWNSRLVPVRALGKCGRGTSADIVDGMRWAAGIPVPGLPVNPNPARVINMSLGGAGRCSLVYAASVADVMAHHAIVVAAAGNDNQNALDSVPAACPMVMTVAAIGPTGDKASYSNFSTALEIAAPGGDATPTTLVDAIGSTAFPGKEGDPGLPDYFFKQGTSQAAPHVSGVLSLMLSVAPGLTVSQMREIVQGTATPFPAGTRCATQGDCGRGIVNAAAAVSSARSLAGQVTNYTDLYFRPTEAGWGIILEQQGNTIFGAWFTYGADGKGVWYFMSALARLGQDDAFSGDMYVATGTPFNLIAGQPSITGFTKVGGVDFYFSDRKNALMLYELNGQVGIKLIERNEFGPATTCTFTTGARNALGNYQDLWWNEAERGWGLNITHQGDTMFVTWFTYGADGTPMWLVATEARKSAPGVYAGTVYRTTGKRPEATADEPVLLTVDAVGSMTLNFTDGEHGVFTYNVLGQGGVKPITRQVFSSPVTQCR